MSRSVNFSRKATRGARLGIKPGRDRENYNATTSAPARSATVG